MEPHNNQDTAELRHRAESLLRRAVSRSLPTLPPENVEALVHELRIHETELQLQCEELRRAQFEAEESRNRYRELYESIPIGYMTTDLTGRLYDVNPAGLSLLGAERHAPLAKSMLSFLRNGDAVVFRALCKDALASGRTTTCELTMTRRDGTSFWASLHATPVPAGGSASERVRIAFTDMSRQKEAEELLRRHEAELESRKVQLQVLTGRLFAAQEDERKRIARDIHDDHCQRVTALILESRSMAKFCEHHAPALACRAASMADGLASLLRDFRTLSHELHPRNLDDMSLAMSARRLIDEFGDRAGFTIGFREERVPERLATPLPTCLFRLLQENLSNISKHAKATHVEVALVGRDGHIHLTVSDNGQGFDADAVMQNRTGIGLLGMQERVRPLNGTVQIESRPGVGTTVSITIPLPREEETLASFR